MAWNEVVPVILCGGAGTRLWPVSRKNFPKQVVPLIDGESLLELTLKRASALSDEDRVICIANEGHRFFMQDVMSALGMSGDILLEPAGRNTAPAICCAALTVPPDTILVCLPSDHICRQVDTFCGAIERAAAGAREGLIMTLGVDPSYPSTEYGYVVPGDRLKAPDGTFRVDAFVEKPPEPAAARLIARGARWNAGIFVAEAGTLVDAITQHAPDIAASCRAAVRYSQSDGRFVRLDSEAFWACPSVSFDYAVLERHHLVGMAPLDCDWSDLGSWNAVAELTPADRDGNRSDGDVHTVDCQDVFVHSHSRLAVAVGLRNVAIVDTPDAVFVAARGQAQKAASVADYLKRNGRSEHKDHKKVLRPWGGFEQIDQGEHHQVKKLTVKPGAALSLQYHHHRSEHWVVVRGVARVTIDNIVFQLKANQSTYVPPGAVHRLENPGAEALEIIEVQFGEYLAEDDIVRLDDLYGRLEAGTGREPPDGAAGH